MLLVLLRAAALVAAWSARPAVAMAAAAAAVRAPALRSAVTQLDPHPSAANCSELIFEQPLDHSDYNEQPTWQQSYFLCDQFLRGDDPAPLILFYVGNEGPVTNAVSNMGLLWELAAEWRALLVWAESQPLGHSANGTAETFRHLAVEQALVDYIKLIEHLRDEYGGPKSPVVAFGASYGAMLAAWLRFKYPAAVQAALAASAPLRSNLVDGQGWDPSTFWQQAERRDDRLSRKLPFAHSPSPRTPRLCFSDPDHPLPAWPLRAMCETMGEAAETSDPKELLGALAAAVAIVHNVTGAAHRCYSNDDVFSIAMQTSSPYSGSAFTYQVCAQFVPSESFFPPNGTTDMFFDAGGFNASWVRSFCRQQFGRGGPVPNFRTLPLLFGATVADFQAGASNILFSNGLLDPWSSGGFLGNLSDSLPSLVIHAAGHHVDLYWPDPADPPSYAAVRAQERQILAGWVDTWRRSGGGGAVGGE
ncbi:hypothetical protein ABPG77_003297 [Micractinium sp. CCAP 211/92]